MTLRRVLLLTTTLAFAGTQAHAAGLTQVPGSMVSGVPLLANNGSDLNGPAFRQNLKETVHVVNLTALVTFSDYSAPVLRDGYALPGDGGRGVYNHGAAACPAADNGTQVTAVDGGCWTVDLSSIAGQVSPCLFESCTTATDDTAAIQAAYNTKRTVNLGGFKSPWAVSSDVTRSTPGQTTHGDGRFRTIVSVKAPGGFTKGVFVDAAGSFSDPSAPGPVDQDYTVVFTQPDTSSTSAMTAYVPAFYARNTPRFRMEHMGCALATTCVDMKGQSGGSTFDDFQFNAFATGIDIDGSADSVRILSPHWWPFAMTANQQAAFFTQGTGRPIGISSGRMDDLIVDHGLFIGGLAMSFYQGAGTYGNAGPGPTFANITNTDFDTFSGISMTAGIITCASCTFTLGNPASQAVNMSGGKLILSAMNFGVGATLANPAFQAAGNGAYGTPILTVAGGYGENQGNFDNTIFQAGATSAANGWLDIHDWAWGYTVSAPWTNATFTKPIIATAGSGRVTAMGNIAQDKGSNTGTFINVGADNYNAVIGNKAPGWTNTLAGAAMPNSLTGYTGSYFGN